MVALGVLKKGLAKLTESTKAKRDSILARLKQGEKISDADEEFIDQHANFTDEQAVLDALEHSSDISRDIGRLSDKDKTIVEHLKEAAGFVKQAVKKAASVTKEKAATAARQTAAAAKRTTTAAKVVGKRKRPENPRPTNGPKQPRPPTFTHKENATLQQRIEVLDWHHANGKNQTKTAKHFDTVYPNLKIRQPLVSSWLKEEDEWRKRWAATQGEDHNAKRARQTQHPEVTEMMDLWVHRAMEANILLTGEVLRQKWDGFADIVGVPKEDRISLSNGWLSRFKGRHAIKELRRHGEAGSVKPEDVEKERKRVRELIEKYGLRLRDIFNMDETGLFYAMPPDRGLANKAVSGVKGKKVRLTYALTINADGSEKLPPFIIGKAKKPRAFNKKSGADLGFVYRNNAKAWMTTELFQEWLRNWDRDLRRQNRHVLLFVDNFSGHQPPSNLTHIHVEPFEPNLTAHVQPADAGIIRCFKAHYRSRFISRAIDRYDDGITPSSIYDINQLEAMRLADAAWNDVGADTIHNCWLKTGILPSSLVGPRSSVVDDPVQQAEKDVAAALDVLQETGALQAENRLSVGELVDPSSEKLKLNDGDCSDRDIAQAVLQSREAVELSEINGGDDDIDDDADVEPPPTRKEALAAASTMVKYLATVGTPVARSLEVLLGSFIRATRTEVMRDKKVTSILDYFSRT